MEVFPDEYAYFDGLVQQQGPLLKRMGVVSAYEHGHRHGGDGRVSGARGLALQRERARHRVVVLAVGSGVHPLQIGDHPWAETSAIRPIRDFATVRARTTCQTPYTVVYRRGGALTSCRSWRPGRRGWSGRAPWEGPRRPPPAHHPHRPRVVAPHSAPPHSSANRESGDPPARALRPRPFFYCRTISRFRTFRVRRRANRRSILSVSSRIRVSFDVFFSEKNN